MKSPAAIAITTRKPAVFGEEDLKNLCSELPAARHLVAEGVKAFCSVPLLSHDRALGALNVGRRREDTFNPEDVELLGEVAKQIAIAVENAQAYREITELKDRLAKEKPYLEEEVRTDHNFGEIVLTPAAAPAKVPAGAPVTLADAEREHILGVLRDEVDIHVNPKIGLDWMARGQQKEVVTPGTNVKRYLAGALDVRTGLLTWVEGEWKASALFIALLDKLLRFYPKAEVIHVVLDNYRIHDSKITQAALRGFRGRIRLHFLPPYCPKENKIERVWEDLHAYVTRNHTCPGMEALMTEVREYLWRRNRIRAGIERRKAG
jgi:transposase